MTIRVGRPITVGSMRFLPTDAGGRNPGVRFSGTKSVRQRHSSRGPSMSSSVFVSPTTLLSAVVPMETRLQHAMNDMRLGRPVILVDDFERENEADLIAAAETISVPTMALFIREGSGIVCLCLTDEILTRLELPQMVVNNESCHQTAFTVTVDAREGITTGVSALDRVTTIRTAIAPDAQPRDLVRPGHVFPLRACPG